MTETTMIGKRLYRTTDMDFVGFLLSQDRHFLVTDTVEEVIVPHLELVAVEPYRYAQARNDRNIKYQFVLGEVTDSGTRWIDRINELELAFASRQALVEPLSMMAWRRQVRRRFDNERVRRRNNKNDNSGDRRQADRQSNREGNRS